MIDFKQLCELLTCDQRYQWFLIDLKYMPSLSNDELSTVHTEDIGGGYVRMWYPREKWDNKPMNPEELKRLIRIAMEQDDYVLAKKLVEKLKKV